MSEPQSKRLAAAAFSCPEPEFHLTAFVPVNSCTDLRSHGRTTHQPEDVPYGGFRPELRYYPPLSHGSSRCQVEDRRTQGRRRDPGSELPTDGSASLFEVKHCGTWFLYDLCGSPRYAVSFPFFALPQRDIIPLCHFHSSLEHFFFCFHFFTGSGCCSRTSFPQGQSWRRCIAVTFDCPHALHVLSSDQQLVGNTCPRSSIHQ